MDRRNKQFSVTVTVLNIDIIIKLYGQPNLVDPLTAQDMTKGGQGALFAQKLT